MLSVVPQPLIQNATGITFYLKHFRISTIEYILEKTDYDHITEYEILAREWDSFHAQISDDGYLSAERPQVDETKFALFELSLHHLESHVLNRIMDYYIGMDQLDYELLYPDYNTIYVAVPYKSWVLKKDTDDECDCAWCDETIKDGQFEIKWANKYYEDLFTDQMKLKKSGTFGTEGTEDAEGTEATEVEEEPKPLQGWWFTLNLKTKNSYVLTPTLEKNAFTITNKQVSYKWGKIVHPTTWNAPIEGLERPLYFNETAGGWIVSLRHKQALLDAGAILYLQ